MWMSGVGGGRRVERRALTLQWLKKIEAIRHYLQQKTDNEDASYLLKCDAIFLGYFDWLFTENVLLQSTTQHTFWMVVCVKWEVTEIARCWWPSVITSCCMISSIATDSNTMGRMQLAVYRKKMPEILLTWGFNY